MQSGDGNNQGNDISYAILLEAIRTEARKTREEIKEEIKIENAKLLMTIQEQKAKIENLESKYSELENKYKKLERQCKKNNIIIFGLEVEETTNLVPFILHKFRDLLGINITQNDISNIYQITRGSEVQTKIQFTSYLKKTLVLENAKKLKGTQISIAQDLCYEDLQDQKILRKHLKLAKSKNHFAKIKGHKLVINDNIYTADQLRQTDYELNQSMDGTEREGRHSAPTTPSFSRRDSPKHTAKRKKSEKEAQGSSSEITNLTSNFRVTRQNSQK